MSGRSAARREPACSRTATSCCPMRPGSALNWMNRCVVRIWGAGRPTSAARQELPVEEHGGFVAFDPCTMAGLDEQELAGPGVDLRPILHQVAHLARDDVLAVVHRTPLEAFGIRFDLLVPAPAR